MSERSYVVYIDNLDKLNFEEFYNEFLNKDGEYEEVYVTDGTWNLKDLKNGITYLSTDYTYDRLITDVLADYIATKGMPIEVRDISGWCPVITILSKNMRKV